MKLKCLAQALFAISLLTTLAQPALSAIPKQSAKAVPALAAAKAVKKYSIEQFFATTRISGASFSADEKQVMFNSDTSGIFNAYTLDATGGGTPLAVTKSSTDTTFGVSYFPHDNRILYTRDNSGYENNHLFVREADSTEKDLTPGEKVKASFVGWKLDGSAFFVTSNERDPKFFDL